MKCARLLTVAGILSAGICGTASAQTLVGDTVEFWVQPQLTGIATLDSSAVVVTPGFEFSTEILGETISTLNIEATSIRLDAIRSFNSPYFNTGFDPTYFEIRDLNFVGEPGRYISGVDVSFSRAIGVNQGSPPDWPDFSSDNVTFTADSVRISIGGYDFPEGTFVLVNLITVPAPSAVGLLGMGGFVAMGRRRRR